MFESFRRIFTVGDLRKKILYTFMIIVIFRFGASLPVPFLNLEALAGYMQENSNNFFGYLDILSGGALGSATIFAMSISPYINASIIMQLLTIAIPALEKLQKEGEEGRKKIQKATRYLTVALGIIQAIGYYLILKNTAKVVKYTSGFNGWFSMFIIVAVFTAGTALIVWLGEQISEKGIGNGISMILFAGIISRGPSAILLVFGWLTGGDAALFVSAIAVIIIFLAVITLIVFFTNAERRIPVQYAKRVVGRKMYGGQSTYIPIKVNMSGVMPIIFASSIMSIPSMIATFAGQSTNTEGVWGVFLRLFHHTSWFYAIFYFILIIGFNFFYVTVQYNPIEIANNLRKNNGAIPGIRPGKPTSTYISRVLSKITVVGALFLGIVAVFPIIFSIINPNANISLGGTSVLIIVGVALETVRTVGSQMTMRHHKGFLE